jgi:hypothetical protein
MARKPTTTIDPQIEAVRSYLEGVAKKVSTDLFGPNGPKWGTQFSELEELAVQVRTVFSEKFLEITLQRQADAPQESRPVSAQQCPSCQRNLDAPDSDPEPRTVQSRAGQADWSEPKAFCTDCRRSFFPSKQISGH